MGIEIDMKGKAALVTGAALPFISISMPMFLLVPGEAGFDLFRHFHDDAVDQ